MTGVNHTLKDIRPKAEEKARRKAEGLQQEAPPGNDGFMSERTRAKEALREEVNTYTGANVRKIAATTATAEEDRILRVAAYCRVSTDDIDQLISIEMQKNNYRDMIKANPKWKYVGTYVDDGFSGTNTDHRPAFKLMMRDAMAGKIDMIITKSVSRFARNLLDCIGWVRKLKERDPPIQVFFEQEHLNTLDTTSNIILFVLAMVAEEESHMKSEAMLLSLEWRFSRGRFLTPALLGYDKVEMPDGHGGHKKVLRINEEEAKTVRLIFYLLLNGYSTADVADTLNELHRETGQRKVSGRQSYKWTNVSVYNIARNERYCGDVLARKTWTPDFHDHKSKRNNGKKNKYYAASDKGGNQFVYTINMTMPNKIRTGELTDLQRSCITRLYERFFKKPFTVEKAAMLLKTKGSSASFHLTNFVERGIMATNGEPGKPLSYTILVNPREYPECFIKGEAIQEIGKRLPMKPTGSQHAVAI